MDSRPQQAFAGNNGIFSQKTMDELGIAYTDAPTAKRCQYCGNVLYHQCFVINSNPIRWLEAPEWCTCEKAVEDKVLTDNLKRIEKQRQETEQAEKDTRKRIDAIIGQSGMGKRFLNRTFGTFMVNEQNKRAYERANSYALQFSSIRERGTGLYFEGGQGTGKTHLAAAVTLDVADKGVPVLFRTGINMLADIREAMKQDGESKTINLYKTVPLLVIDDLGKEKPTEWTSATLYSIINDRYENLMPVIVTTNFSADELADRLTPTDGARINAEAIVSRLKECCICITMDWEDYRIR